MIERVAAAMWERTHDGRWDDWGDGQDESRIIHRDDARAAIEAMREPTDAMEAAGDDTFVYYTHSTSLLDGDATVCWRAMIDAALKEQP